MRGHYLRDLQECSKRVKLIFAFKYSSVVIFWQHNIFGRIFVEARVEARLDRGLERIAVRVKEQVSRLEVDHASE